jgi:hypothetical protein
MRLLSAKPGGEIYFPHINQFPQKKAMSTQTPTSLETPTSSDPSAADQPLPVAVISYFRSRLANRIHEVVLTEFSANELEGKTSRAKLARIIRRKPEQITRWLGSPGNWTLDTVSDLLLGIGLEPVISTRSILAKWNSPATGTQHQTTIAQRGGQVAVQMQTAEEVERDIALGIGKDYYFSFSAPPIQRLQTVTVIPFERHAQTDITQVTIAKAPLEAETP